MLTLSQKKTVLWERPQQIASRLARNGHTVLFVQGPLYLDTFQWIITSENLFLKRKIDNRLTAVNMFLPPLQGKLKRVNGAFQVSMLKVLLSSLHFKPDVAVFYGNGYVSLLRTLRSMGTKILYDCVDEISGFSDVGDVARALREEKDLAANSSSIIVTSQALRQKFQKINPNCFYIPNGADVSHFLNSAQVNEKVQELEPLQHPIIGYHGAVSDWFDVDLVCRLADSHPEYSVLIVGPVNVGLEKFKKHPNITLVGAKKYEILPKYLAYMDVCIIPFKINKLTLAVNPIKLYEYLAAGKPVVSTPLPEVYNSTSGFVYVGKDAEDFIRKVEEAVEERSKPEYAGLVARRIGFAEDSSWDKRVQAFETSLQLTLQQR